MSELSPKPVRSDEEQHRLRFEEGSNATQRSAEEQRRLMEEYDQARYEEAFPVDEEAEGAYNEAMEAREYEKNALIEGRILERQDNGEGKEVLVRPEANRMYMMAQQIAELRANGGESKIIADKENKLQELLEKYSEEAHTERDLRLRNAEINERSTVKGAEIRLKEEMEAEEELARRLEEADFIINSTDEAWVNERVPTAAEEELKSPKDAERSEAEKKFVKDPVEARLLAEVERISREIKSNPAGAEKAGLYDKVSELLEEVEKAIAAAKKAEEEVKTPKDADEGEIKTPKDAKTDEEEIKTPKDSADLDNEEVKTPKDAASDDEEIKTPKDAVLEDHEEDKPTKKSGLLRRAWNRVAVFGYETGGASPAGVVRHGLERFRDSENKGKIAAFIGAAAIIGVGIWGRSQGWFDGHGGGGNQDPNANGGQDLGDAAGQNDRHPDGMPDTSNVPPAEVLPQIPDGSEYAHPWNWMKAAMENGSIKTPDGMGPEDALHYFGEKAAASDHTVEWYNLPNGLEAVRVDGHEDVGYISLVMSEVANNIAQNAQKAVQ
jgi:hypothetical protein